MKTFNAQTKQKYIQRAIMHKEQDEIVQGFYWEDGKGCCVGCLAHVNDDAYAALEAQTGIPVWLSMVAETLHMRLPDGEFQKWPQRLITAMPENVTHEDLEKKVKAPFLVILLKSALKTFDHDKRPDVKDVIEQSITLWQRDDIGSDDFTEAARAARAAGAAKALGVVKAAKAARTAWAAAWAAEAVWAARAAARAAGATAREEEYVYFSNELERLLKRLG